VSAHGAVGCSKYDRLAIGGKRSSPKEVAILACDLVVTAPLILCHIALTGMTVFVASDSGVPTRMTVFVASVSAVPTGMTVFVASVLECDLEWRYFEQSGECQCPIAM